MVEAAFITPLFMLLLFGIIEWGFATYDRETAANMSIVGARSASGNGADSDADYKILQQIKGASAGTAASKIRQVIIYRATGAGDRVPPACLTASVQNTPSTRGCNRYTGADLALDQTQFGCVGPPGPAQKIDRFWCPTTRKTALTGINGPPDFIGVYIDMQHDMITGLFGRTFSFTTDTVFQIEPRTLK